MEKKIFTLVLVVAIGVLVGVSVVSKQARQPMLRELLVKQNAILQTQERIEKTLNSPAAVGGNQIGTLVQRQDSIEIRLAAIESKISSLENTVKQARAGGGNAGQRPPPEDFSRVYDIDIAHSLVKGKKNAPVTIVEFSDFQCPFCARFHTPVQEVLAAYPDQVNFVLKNFPLGFHEQARPAAKAAFAAGEQGKYWEMVDALLENQKSLSEDKYEELAKSLGLNVKKFLTDYKNKDAQWEDYIQKDIALAGQVGVRGTPTFYINGKKTNARDFSSFKIEIDQILNNK